MGSEFDGDHLSRGVNFMWIICPGGQEVGDRKSGDQTGLGPNVPQPDCEAWMIFAKYICHEPK